MTLRNFRIRRETAALACALVTGCYVGLDRAPGQDTAAGDDAGSGSALDGGSVGDSDDGSGLPGETPALIPASGARRLTPTEFASTVEDLLGIDASVAATLLPTPDYAPFDNDYSRQTESAALIVGHEALARKLVGDLVADAATLQALTTCPLDGSIDAACFSEFVRAFGRRALRRPPSEQEIGDWSTAFIAEAESAGSFVVAYEMALQMLLQHPELLYRIDRGETVDADAGIIRLDDWSVASRLSYLLWGSGPDDALLDAAAAGSLQTPEGVRNEAMRMLDDPRARARSDRFHAMWLGYESFPISGALGESMLAETRALIERVVFDDDAAWTELFVADETFVDAALAAHYGLPAPADPAGDWVAYADSGRGGVLSHGTFLSNGFKAGDTSPTLRGKLVRATLLCQPVPPPPPNVPDSVPGSTDEAPCKVDRYAAHRTDASCAACHAQMDGIGFGLENYDQQGRFREHDVDHPECVIDGAGEVVGLGSFHGPAELGTLLASSQALVDCVLEQSYRFAVGRTTLDDIDAALLERLRSESGSADFRMKDLLLAHVSDPSFGFARQTQGDQ